MHRHRQNSGYSLTELLTVVALVGIVLATTIPGIFQLYPQQRLKAAGVELSGTVRMARQNAIGTRSPWRVAFDFTNDRYAVFRLRGPSAIYRPYGLNPPDFKVAEITNAAWWIPVDRRGRDMAPGTPDWRNIPGVDLRSSSAKNFFHTDCTGASSLPGPDLVFLPSGSVARNGDCSAPTTDLTFTGVGGVELLPEVVLAVNNSFVAVNRYRVQVKPTGAVIVVSEKQ